MVHEKNEAVEVCRHAFVSGKVDGLAPKQGYVLDSLAEFSVTRGNSKYAVHLIRPQPNVKYFKWAVQVRTPLA